MFLSFLLLHLSKHPQDNINLDSSSGQKYCLLSSFLLLFIIILPIPPAPLPSHSTISGVLLRASKVGPTFMFVRNWFIFVFYFHGKIQSWFIFSFYFFSSSLKARHQIYKSHSKLQNFKTLWDHNRAEFPILENCLACYLLCLEIVSFCSVN